MWSRGIIICSRARILETASWNVAIPKIVAGAKLDDCFLQRSVCILGSTSFRAGLQLWAAHAWVLCFRDFHLGIFAFQHYLQQLDWSWSPRSIQCCKQRCGTFESWYLLESCSAWESSDIQKPDLTGTRATRRISMMDSILCSIFWHSWVTLLWQAGQCDALQRSVAQTCISFLLEKLGRPHCCNCNNSAALATSSK